MGTLAAAQALAEQLTAAGVRAVTDPRSAVPPCVLVPPPTRTYDLGSGYTITWRLLALAPGPGTADSWAALDQLVDTVETVAIITRAEPTSYTLTAGGEPMPAYAITCEEAS